MVAAPDTFMFTGFNGAQLTVGRALITPTGGTQGYLADILANPGIFHGNLEITGNLLVDGTTTTKDQLLFQRQTGASNDNIGGFQNLSTTDGVAAMRYFDATVSPLKERGAMGYGGNYAAASTTPTYRAMFIEYGNLMPSPDDLGTSIVFQNTHVASSLVLPGVAYTSYRADETGYHQWTTPTVGLALSISVAGKVGMGGVSLTAATPSQLMVNGGVDIGSNIGVGAAVASGNLRMSGTYSQGTVSTTYTGNVVGRWRFEETGNGDTIQTNSAVGVIGSSTSHSLTYQSHLGGVTALGNDGTNGILAASTNITQFRVAMSAGTGDPTTGTLAASVSTIGLALNVNTGLTAVGTTRADALALTRQINNVTTAGAGTGVILPSVATAVIGTIVYIYNNGANAIQVYGAGSDTIDGVAAATGVPLTNAKRCAYTATAAATWISAQLGVVSA